MRLNFKRFESVLNWTDVSQKRIWDLKGLRVNPEVCLSAKGRTGKHDQILKGKWEGPGFGMRRRNMLVRKTTPKDTKRSKVDANG